MNTIISKDPQLNNLLSRFDDPASYQLNMQQGQKPNIKMTIKSNNAVSMSSNKAKTTRVTRCRGSLVKNHMGVLKPKIRCSSTKLNSKPREEGERQSDLLKQIIGEVDREKQNVDVGDFGDSETPHAGAVMSHSKPSGCGCSQKRRASCGSHTSKPNLNSNLNLNSNMPIHEEEQMPIDNTENKKKSKRKRKRKKRARTHKVVEVNLSGNKPSIPVVNVKANKKKRQRSKRVKKESKKK